MNKDYGDEQVLVCPTAVVQKLFTQMEVAENGALATGGIDAVLNELMEGQHLSFLDRSEAETNPDYRQLIPYLIITAPNEVMVLSYTRGVKGAENRLHGKRSIGVGGHINPVDQQHCSCFTREDYLRAAERELEEEIGLVNGRQFISEPFAFLFTSGTSVDAVHLGIVHRVNLPAQLTRLTDTALVSPIYMYTDELFENRKFFETWSQQIIPLLDSVLEVELPLYTERSLHAV